MVLYQGTTSVVPQWARKTWGLRAVFFVRLRGLMQAVLGAQGPGSREWITALGYVAINIARNPCCLKQDAAWNKAHRGGV
jgi:hypothetical protein